MKRYVVALGGNALLQRGEPLTHETQRKNARVAAQALAPLIEHNEIIITHGNGPQVGLLALRGAANQEDSPDPLDVLDAESEGQIGYVIEQELINVLPPAIHCGTLLTQVEVDPDDPAFERPTKPIGPRYSKKDARRIATQFGWKIIRDGELFRRAVASPRPQRIIELPVIQLLTDHGVVVICAGGGGIPVMRRSDGSLAGVEAVIDKDHASSLLARQIKADGLLLLTDVAAVYQDWGAPEAKAIRTITPNAISRLAFEPGSMEPKVAAACDFLASGGSLAGVGRLQDAADIMAGKAGTLITPDASETVWWN
ncbi:MAG: carbamate kinase [Rhodobacteraceae bacterium]|nr:carbamate kinase [Paracoccaceae bacterium]